MIPEIEDVVPLRARLGDFGWVRFSFATEIVGDRVIPRQMEASLPGANGQPRLTLFIEVIGGVPRLTHLTRSTTAARYGRRTSEYWRASMSGWR